MAEQRYRVIDRLEAGGMAEVFRGEAVSLQGFKKQVAIKRVLPHLAENRSFISMFLDEARLGARLTHANIVSVLDIGAADNTYFIVMEFVDGANLKHILETLKDEGKRMGVKEALYIAMEVCRGLNFAHEVCDDDGVLLNIVHRDISPPNILLTKRGEVKVTDFGLAKASTQLEKTDPGVVKGKFSYLAPEAAMGEEVDARADVFAVGIIIWEALAGRRLFLGDTDYDTVKAVQKAIIPKLSDFNDEVDDGLEKLLAGALAKNLDDRFESARAFGDAIADYLFSEQKKVTSYDVGNMMTWVLSHRKKKKQLKPAEVSIIDQLIQEELIAFTSLDDMNDPLDPRSGTSRPPPPDMNRAQFGAMPLDAGTFADQLEDPGAWFSDDKEVGSAVAAAGGNNAPLTQSDPPDLAGLLEDESTPPPSSPPISAAPEFDDAVTAKGAQAPPAAAPGVDPDKTDPPRAEGGGGAGKYIVIAIIVLAGAGAAAWFGNIIPH